MLTDGGHPAREPVYNEIENLEAEIDANKMILIDNNFIQQGFYVSSDAWGEIQSANSIEELGENYGLTNPQLQIVKDLTSRVEYALSDGYNESDIDLDGALILPFQATDLSYYETINTITIEFSWDFSGSVSYDSTEDRYFLTDRICGLPFNFDVELVID